MKSHQAEYSIEGMCACFKVCRSSYYAWLHRKPAQRYSQRQGMDERVKALFYKHKQCYGALRIQKQMERDYGQHHNLKTIASSLQRQALIAK